MVFGIENKGGFFWNFEKSEFTIWSPNCSIPSQQLAEDLHLILVDRPEFSGTDIVSIPVD